MLFDTEEMNGAKNIPETPNRTHRSQSVTKQKRIHHQRDKIQMSKVPLASSTCTQMKELVVAMVGAKGRSTVTLVTVIERRNKEGEKEE